MKVFLITLVIALSGSCFGEALIIDGQYKLGKKLFDKGVPATLHLDIDETGIDAALDAPGAACVFQFTKGSLKSTFTETVIYKGIYEVYLLPMTEDCDAYTSDPLKLIIRKDFNGRIISVVIRINSRRNHWAYFISN